MSISSLGMTLEDRDTIEFRASRSEETAWVAIRSSDAQCEIRMDRVHVEALRDQIPDVLTGLDRVAAEDTACVRAEIAGERATDAAARALDKARMVEEAGAHDVAESLRAAAAKATASANAVDAAVQAFVEATAYADSAADTLIYISQQADAALVPRAAG
jgi:hypothetical protein